MRIIGYDDDADEMDNDDDLDNEGREGARLMVEGGMREADTNWDAQEADLEVQIFFQQIYRHIVCDTLGKRISLKSILIFFTDIFTFS